MLAVLASGLDRKVVYDSHELWPDMLVGVPTFLKRVLQSYESVLVRQADCVMTVNEFIAQELANRYTVKSPVHVVYNCASTQTSAAEKKPQKREVGRTKVALYHGWYFPERGLENLVKASEFLSPNIMLLFRGAGKLEGELRRLASHRRNVRFERPVSQTEVVEAARLADVGIVPYLPTNLCNYYASPNKLFEYLEAGLPVAASNLPFMRKFVLENDIGTLFDARDPRSIAGALNKITRQDTLSHYRRNVVLATRKYNWSVESRKLLNVYANLFHNGS
jgi:glycosyltransferase involved in cell wall biosynthesis